MALLIGFVLVSLRFSLVVHEMRTHSSCENITTV